MMGFRERKRIALPPPAFWSLLILALVVGCMGPLNRQPERRDIESVRLNSESYVTQVLKDLEIYQRNLRQGNGERANTLIRLAQVCCTLGELVETEQRLDYYEKGKYYAELLVREYPFWADGHYWLALNLCGVAEVGGAGRALRLLPEILEIMEKAASIDPTYDQAGPHRVLGRILCEAPTWPISVGDIHKSLHHLTLAVQIAPDNSTNHLFLADTLMRLGKEKLAQVELDKVFKATQHATWPLGVEQDRREAHRLMAKLNNRR
jgi:tetratricopeptide (TPR) repeat protein